jgi:hypothetical protein
MTKKNSDPIEIVYISVAGYTIKMCFQKKKSFYFIKQEIIQLLKHFILSTSPKKIDFTIEFIEKQNFIFIERKHESLTAIYLYEEARGNRIITYNYISATQLFIIIRRVIEKLIKNKGIFLHASSCFINNEVFLFLAKSGGGKTTVSNLIAKQDQKLTDDVAIITQEGGKFFVYQTYFVEESPFFRSIKKFPLGKIFFIKKSNIYKIIKMKRDNRTLDKMTEQIYTELEEYKKEKIAFILNIFSQFDNFYTLKFGKDRKKLEELFKASLGIKSFS